MLRGPRRHDVLLVSKVRVDARRRKCDKDKCRCTRKPRDRHSVPVKDLYQKSTDMPRKTHWDPEKHE